MNWSVSLNDEEKGNADIDRADGSRETKLSIELAKAVGGEIISADSVQVYKKMDIGSAKILPKKWTVSDII